MFQRFWLTRPKPLGQLGLAGRIVGPGYSRVGTFKGVLNFSLRAYGAHHGYHITFLSVHSIVTDRGLPTNLLDVLTRGGRRCRNKQKRLRQTFFVIHGGPNWPFRCLDAPLLVTEMRCSWQYHLNSRNFDCCFIELFTTDLLKSVKIPPK